MASVGVPIPKTFCKQQTQQQPIFHRTNLRTKREKKKQVVGKAKIRKYVNKTNYKHVVSGNPEQLNRKLGTKSRTDSPTTQEIFNT